MCMRCDGYSWEEIDRSTDLVIQVHGFQLLQGTRPKKITGVNENIPIRNNKIRLVPVCVCNGNNAHVNHCSCRSAILGRLVVPPEIRRQ